jgi:tRNA A37 threonylcarbamoyladenosine dehydratase
MGGIPVLHRFTRTELLIGEEGLAKLAQSTVAIFGVGGVGSFAAEALARVGIGNLILIDYDDVCLTNINRQLHALQHTVGQPKVDLMRERILAINPDCRVEALRECYTAEKRDQLIREDYTYIVDAIDMISAKVDLIHTAIQRKIPIIASMGAGNKLDPTRFKVADISKTHTDPMAKAVRKQLKELGITKGLKVVFSSELPLTPRKLAADCKTNCICTNPEGREICTKRRQIPGSISFVPSTAGLIMAAAVVNDVLATGRMS